VSEHDITFPEPAAMHSDGREMMRAAVRLVQLPTAPTHPLPTVRAGQAAHEGASSTESAIHHAAMAQDPQAVLL
jgi:hypothetical protein